MKIRKRAIRRTVGLLLIGIGGFFSSGSALSLISDVVTKVLMLAITILGCFFIKMPTVKTASISRKDKRIGVVLPLTIGIILSATLYPSENNFIDHAILILRIVCALCIANRSEEIQFRKWFPTVMSVLTLCSIVMWMAVITNVPIPSYQYRGANGFLYNTVGFFTWPTIMPRFMGLFWEPGLYASYLIIALLLEGGLNTKKPRWWVLLTCLVGIALTQSTAGYIIALLVIYMIIRQKYKLRMLIDVISICVLVFMYLQGEALLGLLVEKNSFVFEKLMGQSISYNTRMLSPWVCILVALKSPLFGNGLTEAINLYNSYRRVFDIDSLTSTTFFMISAFGLFGIAYTWGWVDGVFNQKRMPMIIKVLLLFSIIMIINKEPHYNILFSYVIMFDLLRTGDKVQYVAQKEIDTEQRHLLE